MTYSQAAPQAPQYEKVDRKVFTGRITKDLEIKTANNGNQFVNIDFAMDIKALESGTQFAQITLWGEDANIANFLFKKGDNIVGSGVVNWREWETQDGQLRKSLEYKYPTLNLDLGKVKDFVRTEIGMALQSLQPQATQPQLEQPAQVAQPQAPQGYAQPAQVEQSAQEGPTLDITSQDLPF